MLEKSVLKSNCWANKIGVVNYYNGLKDGKWVIMDEDGRIRYKMLYDKGEKIGEWIIYDEKGKVIERKQYN